MALSAALDERFGRRTFRANVPPRRRDARGRCEGAASHGFVGRGAASKAAPESFSSCSEFPASGIPASGWELIGAGSLAVPAGCVGLSSSTRFSTGCGLLSGPAAEPAPGFWLSTDGKSSGRGLRQEANAHAPSRAAQARRAGRVVCFMGQRRFPRPESRSLALPAKRRRLVVDWASRWGWLSASVRRYRRPWGVLDPRPGHSRRLRNPSCGESPSFREKVPLARWGGRPTKGFRRAWG